MTEYHWPTIRNHAIRAFKGEVVNQDTEQAIQQIFGLYPTVIVRLIDDIAEDVANGKARSGWATLRYRAAAASRPAAEITVQGEDRETAIRQAERYIHNAGLHYDRWQDELEDELFGDRGRLHAWQADAGLRERLHRLWQEQRPKGQAIEHQQNEDAANRVAYRAARAKLTREEIDRQNAEATATIQALIDQKPSPTDDDIPF
jgi:hypothetical protein